jgi:hypothetical protein
MKVMMMNLEAAEDLAKRTGPAGQAYRDAWAAYYQRVAAKTIGGHPIDVSISPTTLRTVDGQRQVQDGPFADSRESLGGYFIFEVDSLAEAIELASGNPCLERGAVELRVIAERKSDA